MKLYPCAYSMTFSVKDGKLNGLLNQRSNDFLTANNWNVVQYALLVHLFAKVTGLGVGEFVHVIADAHIYDRHVPIIEEIIKKPVFEAPKLIINDVDDFYKITEDDVKVENYKFNDFDIKIPVAI